MATATQPSAGAPADPAPPPETAVPFRVLGPLEVHVARPVPVTARRQQVVLALLLLEAGRGVTLDALVSAVWGGAPPATARSQVQTAVSALRRSLERAGLGRRIRMQGQRYTLELAHGEVDLHVFDDLAARGRAAAAESRPEAARAAFRRALELWRGDPLAGIDSPAVQARAVPVAERRFTVLEACFDAELKLGLHHDVIGEIAALAAEFPLRERPAEQLMTALYRCGRQAEALAAYHRVRRTFIDELGIELSPALRRLELAILNGSPELDQPRTRNAAPSIPAVVPQQLPARQTNFTGREEHLRELCGHLTAGAGAGAGAGADRLAGAGRGLPGQGVQGGASLDGRPAGTTVGTAPVALLAGAPGTGKSALAVEAAHILAPAFPDGQLYAALPAGDPARAVEQVLERFLRALGFPASAVPGPLADRAALFRGALAERRVLVVVEDAADAAQLRALLPAAPGCALLATGRRRSAAPAGARTVDVAAPSVPDGVELLAAMAGWERVRAEPSEAIELTELCDGLPLALRAAAGRLAAHPQWSLADLTARLRDERRRLAGLAHRDIDLRAVLAGAYRALTEPARTLLARLGGLPTPEFAAWSAGPLLDSPPAEAARALAALADMRLVEPVGPAGPGGAIGSGLPVPGAAFGTAGIPAAFGAVGGPGGPGVSGVTGSPGGVGAQDPYGLLDAAGPRGAGSGDGSVGGPGFSGVTGSPGVGGGSQDRYGLLDAAGPGGAGAGDGVGAGGGLGTADGLDAALLGGAAIGAGVRYRIPGLVRLFAAERLAERFADDPREERGAGRRMLDVWLTLTEEAVLRLGGAPAPGLHHPQRWPLDLPTVTAVLHDPAGWYAAERDALRAAVRYAADADETELHRRLAVAVCSLAATQRAYEDWRDCATQALTAAREAGDRLGEAALLYSLGALDEEQGREDEARARLRGALGAFEQLGADAWCELAAEALERLDRAAQPAAGYPTRSSGRSAGRPGVAPVAGQPRWTQGQFGKAARGYDGAQPRTAGAAGGWGGAARHRPVAPSGPFPNRHRNDPMEDR